ncbi:MAG: Rrf2 family transcriptional regulator [Clostridiales bacterium]|nr:Rrf2 family transcriptional regulator [Clostridiales bacterium]
MKLSTKGRYGLRAVIDLAMHDHEDAVALSQIAERQGISMNYLEQLIARLKKAGIVNGIRGAQGGYKLAVAADKISVGDILRALEGDLSPVDCSEVIATESTTGCSNADTCVAKYVWKRITDSINEAVDGIMLSELVDESRKIQADSNGNDTKAKYACGK